MFGCKGSYSNDGDYDDDNCDNYDDDDDGDDVDDDNDYFHEYENGWKFKNMRIFHTNLMVIN